MVCQRLELVVRCASRRRSTWARTQGWSWRGFLPTPVRWSLWINGDGGDVQPVRLTLDLIEWLQQHVTVLVNLAPLNVDQAGVGLRERAERHVGSPQRRIAGQASTGVMDAQVEMIDACAATLVC